MPCCCVQTIKARLVNSGIVRSHSARIAAEAGSLIQHTCYVDTADPVADGDVDAFMAEVVGDRQALQATPVGQGIAHKVHTPHSVERGRRVQVLAFGRWSPAAKPVRRRQLRHLSGQTLPTLGQAVTPTTAQQEEDRRRRDRASMVGTTVRPRSRPPQ